jgi:tRNA G10  N-methylase Trm11
MQYFFILGKNKTLSLAELASVFGNENLELAGDAVLLKTEEKLDAPQIMAQLGGTIKMGTVEQKSDAGDKEEIEKRIVDMVLSRAGKFNGKFKFGFSQYHKKQIVDPKKLGMEIKKTLKEKGVSSRMVTSREKTLSSVVVEQNKLTGKGAEIVLIKKDNEILIGETLAVQPFKELSRRDYGRPARDDYSGMLPPKLAQIMINLGGNDKKNIFDPFCGSGTILSEALLSGYSDILGNDISEKAVADTAENLTWVSDTYHIHDYNCLLFNQDASRISNVVKKDSIDLIVAETYLGPSRGKFDINKTASELSKLYSSCLAEFKKILKKNGRVVMALPVFSSSSKKNKKINIDIAGYNRITPIPSTLIKHPEIEVTDKNSIIYGRSGQKVWREIIILEK